MFSGRPILCLLGKTKISLGLMIEPSKINFGEPFLGFGEPLQTQFWRGLSKIHTPL